MKNWGPAFRQPCDHCGFPCAWGNNSGGWWMYLCMECYDHASSSGARWRTREHLNTNTEQSDCGVCADAGHSTPDWQKEHDSLIEFVVLTCLESRHLPKERQAAHLRDTLLSACDPLFLVTQRLGKPVTR